MMQVLIKYFDGAEPINHIGGIEKSAWIDLRANKDVFLMEGEFALIPLGVAMQLPDGYEAHVLPRSSTYKNFGIIMTNSCGIIDHSYMGDNDQWHFPAYALRNTEIHRGDRICQFRIVEIQPEFQFFEVASLGNEDRGGIGSTGIK